MKTSKKALVLGVGLVGLALAGQALATAMAFRITALGCIGKSSANYKLNMPTGATGDWGVLNMDTTSPMTIFCPLPLNASTSVTDINQRVNSVSIVGGGPGPLTCNYQLIEQGGGLLTSVDVTASSADVTIPALSTSTAPAGYQLATGNLNRHLFVCTLPVANQVFPVTAKALLRALEVNYGL
jgi:hypothetical protein